MKLTDAQCMAKRIQTAVDELNRITREAQEAGMEVYPDVNKSAVDNPWREVHAGIYMKPEKLTYD